MSNGNNTCLGNKEIKQLFIKNTINTVRLLYFLQDQFMYFKNLIFTNCKLILKSAMCKRLHVKDKFKVAFV